MNLNSASREYATWTFTFDADPGVVAAPEVLVGTDWKALEWLDTDGTTRRARGLLAGPTATGNPGGTIVIPVGRHILATRITDAPELIYRESSDAVVVVA